MPPCRHREEAHLPADRSGERAALVTEQLAQEQLPRDRAAVDDLMAAISPGAEPLDRGATSSFPVPDSPCIRTGTSMGATLLDPPEERLHRRAPADDPVKRGQVRTRHRRPAPIPPVSPPADMETPSLTRGCPSGLGAGRYCRT